MRRSGKLARGTSGCFYHLIVHSALPMKNRNCPMTNEGARVARAALLVLGIAGLTLSGCVSQATARAQAQAAFLAGQRQAAVERGPGQAQGPFVTIYGSVRQQEIPWQPGLTLAKALVASGYYGPEPRGIFVVRNGQAKRVDPEVLLRGSDVPLQPGDIVQVDQGP